MLQLLKSRIPIFGGVRDFNGGIRDFKLQRKTASVGFRQQHNTNQSMANQLRNLNEGDKRAIALHKNMIQRAYAFPCGIVRRSYACPNLKFCRDKFNCTQGVAAIENLRKQIWIDGQTVTQRKENLVRLLNTFMVERESESHQDLIYFLNGVKICKSYFKVSDYI